MFDNPVVFVNDFQVPLVESMTQPRKKSQLFSLAEIMPKAFDQCVKGPDPLLRLQMDWERIVGEKLATKTQPARISNKTLWIESTSPVWTQEFQFIRHTALEKVQKLVDVEITSLKCQTATRLSGSNGLKTKPLKILG